MPTPISASINATFNSISQVLVDGQPAADLTTSTRNGTRYDEYSYENVNVMVNTMTFQFRPERLNVIQIGYVNPDGSYEIIGRECCHKILVCF